MSTLTRPTVAEQIAAARRARDEGIANAEASQHAEWDRRLIDQAIDAFAEARIPFSANDIRDLVGDVRSALMGARFRQAAAEDRIRFCGRTTSTKKNTHAKDVAMWIGITRTEEPA